MGEGQLSAALERREDGGEIGAAAEAQQALGSRGIVDAVDPGRQRPAGLRA